MTLEQTLQVAIRRLRFGNLDNEAQVKSAVILPILRELGWNDADPEMFRPEYPAGGGFVDYALLHHGSPKIFVEAKQKGKINAKGEEQLFRYAVNRGVPLLILTDGEQWHFYLSMAAGIPEERCFYRLDFTLENKLQEYVKSLENYLKRDHVISEKARRSAEERHEKNLKNKEARKAIPSAWRSLLKESEEIRDALAEKVKSESGTKPELDDIDEFLQNLQIPAPSRPVSQPSKPAHRQSTPEPETPFRNPAPSKQSKIIGFILDGKEFPAPNAIKTLSDILVRLSQEDPEFMERFATATDARVRRVVAKKRSDLHTMGSRQVKQCEKLENGWWLFTHHSTDRIRKYVQTACEIAGIEFGSQLRLIER